jgi:hypothetical protein
MSGERPAFVKPPLDLAKIDGGYLYAERRTFDGATWARVQSKLGDIVRQIARRVHQQTLHPEPAARLLAAVGVVRKSGQPHSAAHVLKHAAICMQAVNDDARVVTAVSIARAAAINRACRAEGDRIRLKLMDEADARIAQHDAAGAARMDYEPPEPEPGDAEPDPLS